MVKESNYGKGYPYGYGLTRVVYHPWSKKKVNVYILRIRPYPGKRFFNYTIYENQKFVKYSNKSMMVEEEIHSELKKYMEENYDIDIGDREEFRIKRGKSMDLNYGNQETLDVFNRRELKKRYTSTKCLILNMWPDNA